jgi:hypothetical protein
MSQIRDFTRGDAEFGGFRAFPCHGPVIDIPGEPWEELQKIIPPRPDRSKGDHPPARSSRVEPTINYSVNPRRQIV